MELSMYQKKTDIDYADSLRKGTTSGSNTLPGSSFTSASIKSLKEALNQSKFAGAEADGKYADPNLYYANYKSFVDGGGSASEFLETFPPSTYINPANTFLPEEIMRFAKKQSSSSTLNFDDL